MKNAPNHSYFLIALGIIVPMVTSRLTRRAASKSYEFFTHEEAPKNPGNPNVEWKDALVWAAVTGLLGGLARVTTLRLLSSTIIPSEGDDMDEELEDIA